MVYDVILELVKRHWNRRLVVEHCVLCFLWHIGTRDSFRELSTRFGIGETSTKAVTLQIALLINQNLSHYVSYTLSREEITAQKYKFGFYYINVGSVGSASDSLIFRTC